MELLLSMKALVLQMDPSAEGIRDADFLRFLHARDNDEVKAAKFMVQHLKWRRSFVPHGFIDKQGITKELDRKQTFMQGHDKYGCPIIVILTSRHHAYERDLEEIKRYFVYTFDKATMSNKGEEGKFTIIGDLKDWGLANMDIQGYLAVLDLLQNHYPERLRKLFLVHLPYLFWGAWRVVSPFIDKNTRKKVMLVEDANVEELLLEEADKDQIPTIYGGDLELVPIQDS